MEQIYLGGQVLIVGCSVKGWERYIWEVKDLLLAVESMGGTDIFVMTRLECGL